MEASALQGEDRLEGREECHDQAHQEEAEA
jgi:hypothetical protein